MGYQARIKCIRNDLLPESLLGKTLDRAIIQELENSGVDVCGENGEYHTLVTDGPLFHHPVAVSYTHLDVYKRQDQGCGFYQPYHKSKA